MRGDAGLCVFLVCVLSRDRVLFLTVSVPIWESVRHRHASFSCKDISDYTHSVLCESDDTGETEGDARARQCVGVLERADLENHTPPDIRDSFPPLADGCHKRRRKRWAPAERRRGESTDEEAVNVTRAECLLL